MTDSYKYFKGTLWDAMMVSLRPKLGFASKSGAHDPATFDENDAKFESVLDFMENHLGRFSKRYSQNINISI